jgi:hypothetical protein
MSVGNVLLRPQPFTRRYGSGEAQLVDLAVGLMARLTEDFARGGSASKIIVEAFQAEMTAFAAGIEPRLDAANGKVMNWLNPYITAVESLKSSSFSSPADMLPLIEKVLEAGLLLVNECRSSTIAARLNALADIIENDLGVSYSTFDNLFRSIFDRVIDALATPFLEGSQTEEAVLNFAISRQLMTLRRLLRDAFNSIPFPVFNRRAIIRELQLQLEGKGLNAELDKITQQIEDAKSKIANALPLLQQTLGQGISTRDAGAPCEYSWYASWFLGEPTGVQSRMNLTVENFAPDMGLDRSEQPPIGIEFLEHWAHWSFAIAEVLKAIFYGLQIDRGDKLSPGLHTGWQAINALMSLLAPALTGQTATDFYKVKNNSYFQMGVNEALTLAGSFEEYPAAVREWFWVNLMNDRGKVSDGAKYPDLGYDFFLTLFTLINREGINCDKISGFIKPARLGGSYLASVLLGRKELYYGIGSGHYVIPGLTILLGGVMTFAGEVCGWLIAGAVSRKLSIRYWEFTQSGADGLVEFLGGENAYRSVLFDSYLEFTGTRASFWSGNTDNGKFGVKLVPKPSGITERQEVVLFDYPARESSPYKLPFPEGQHVFCNQGHNDISSHHYRNGMIYAVDFTLQENQVILAMRGGTVVDYRDHLPVGADEGKNYIVIKHTTVDAVHDKGENGAAATTLARYEVAMPHGVRRAFASRGIAEANIIGTVVAQGEPVFLLGERPGFFESDYLQVWVEASHADSIIPTIPFVFSEIDGKGVPEMGKYYESTNTLSIEIRSRLQPDVIRGWIKESAHNYVVFNEAAPVYDISGSHLKITYELPGLDLVTEYRKISAYDTGDKKAVLEGEWSMGFPPPVGAKYTLGSVPYTKARDFDKKFAWVAAKNDAGEEVNFGDGRVPDTVQVP